MKSILKTLIGTLAVLTFVGCSQVNQIGLYSFNQQELQNTIKQHLVNKPLEDTLLGLPLELTAKDLQVQIAPEHKQQVELKLDLAAQLKAIFPLNADVKLHLAATPYFDDAKNAVFLSNLQVLDASFGSGGQQFKLQPLSEQAALLISMVLQSKPLYQLDCQSLTQKVLCEIPLSLQLEPGKISFKPQYAN